MNGAIVAADIGQGFEECPQIFDYFYAEDIEGTTDTMKEPVHEGCGAYQARGFHVAIGELTERSGALFATDSLRSRSPPGRNWRLRSTPGTFHSPALSPEAAGSNEEHERN